MAASPGLVASPAIARRVAMTLGIGHCVAALPPGVDSWYQSRIGTALAK